MQAPGPFPASVLRPPSAAAACTCEHWIHCDCDCHGRHCRSERVHVRCRVPRRRRRAHPMGLPVVHARRGHPPRPGLRADRLERRVPTAAGAPRVVTGAAGDLARARVQVLDDLRRRDRAGGVEVMDAQLLVDLVAPVLGGPHRHAQPRGRLRERRAAAQQPQQLPVLRQQAAAAPARPATRRVPAPGGSPTPSTTSASSSSVAAGSPSRASASDRPSISGPSAASSDARSRHRRTAMIRTASPSGCRPTVDQARPSVRRMRSNSDCAFDAHAAAASGAARESAPREGSCLSPGRQDDEPAGRRLDRERRRKVATARGYVILRIAGRVPLDGGAHRPTGRRARRAGSCARAARAGCGWARPHRSSGSAPSR